MNLSYFREISTDHKRTKVYIDITYFVQWRDHPNIAVRSNNDYGTRLLINPVILVSVTSTSTLEIFVVNKNSDMWISNVQAEKQVIKKSTWTNEIE